MSNNMPPREADDFKQHPWIIRPDVPDEIYTDRTEFLDYFYQAALDAAERRTTSTVLLGQRRMGKTEIFRRVANRLFFEQDPMDPKAVVPVYYTFSDKPQDRFEFAKESLENFIRQSTPLMLLQIFSTADSGASHRESHNSRPCRPQKYASLAAYLWADQMRPSQLR